MSGAEKIVDLYVEYSQFSNCSKFSNVFFYANLLWLDFVFFCWDKKIQGQIFCGKIYINQIVTDVKLF